METWKNVVGYEGHYMISNYGNVKSIKRGVSGCKQSDIILKPGITKYGYRFVVFSVKSKTKPTMIHRLVAAHFIPNQEGKRCVNHIDGNKQNNNTNNLEWMTHSENNTHAYKIGLKKPSNGNNQYLKKK